MSFAETYSRKIATYINNNLEESSSVGVLSFALTVVINYLLVSIAVLIICGLTDNLLLGLLGLFMSPLLRYFSGGIHFKSATLCNIITSCMILISIHVSYRYYNLGLVLTIVSCLILIVYAPQGITNLSKLPPKYYPVLKVIACIIVCSNLIFHSPLLANLFFLQSLTTLSITQKMVDYFKL